MSLLTPGSYSIPAASVQHELVINRSRFIADLQWAVNIDAAKLHLQQLKQAFPDARHHCYAFIAGAPSNSQCLGFSDDGEPSGTAGRPMLNVLQGSGIGEISAVVVRYFGGIKLGTGGLQRAYGGAVRDALVQLATRVKVPMCLGQLTCQYDMLGRIEVLLSQFASEIEQQHFAEQVELTVRVPDHHWHALAKNLLDSTSGKTILKKID